MNTIEQKENSQRVKAIISTSVLHILLFAILAILRVCQTVVNLIIGGLVIS